MRILCFSLLVGSIFSVYAMHNSKKVEIAIDTTAQKCDDSSAISPNKINDAAISKVVICIHKLQQRSKDVDNNTIFMRIARDKNWKSAKL